MEDCIGFLDEGEINYGYKGHLKVIGDALLSGCGVHIINPIQAYVYKSNENKISIHTSYCSNNRGKSFHESIVTFESGRCNECKKRFHHKTRKQKDFHTSFEPGKELGNPKSTLYIDDSWNNQSINVLPREFLISQVKLLKKKNPAPVVTASLDIIPM